MGALLAFVVYKFVKLVECEVLNPGQDSDFRQITRLDSRTDPIGRTKRAVSYDSTALTATERNSVREESAVETHQDRASEN